MSTTPTASTAPAGFRHASERVVRTSPRAWRRSRRAAPAIPEDLLAQATSALERVDRARAALRATLAQPASTGQRRAAHAALTRAFVEADRPLREIATLARTRFPGHWSTWRARLSALDAARQAHLFAQADTSAMLRAGSVRAVDTGMSGPAIGELQHGESMEPGTPARYGLDVEAVLLAEPVPAGPVADQEPSAAQPRTTPTTATVPTPATASATVPATVPTAAGRVAA